MGDKTATQQQQPPNGVCECKALRMYCEGAVKALHPGYDRVVFSVCLSFFFLYHLITGLKKTKKTKHKANRWWTDQCDTGTLYSSKILLNKSI